MPLAGRQLTVDEALALCWNRGWRRKHLRHAVAIMTAESGRYVEAYNDNLAPDGTVISRDRGLFQINDKAHPTLSDTKAFKAVPNATYAYILWTQGGDDEFPGSWEPWAVWESGAYRKYLPIIYAAWLARGWRKLRTTIDQELG